MLARNSAEKEALQQDYPRLQSGSHVIQGASCHLYRLKCIAKGIELEAKGMKISRGKSCTMVARQMFGLSTGVSRQVVLERLQQEIKEFENG